MSGEKDYSGGAQRWKSEGGLLSCPCCKQFKGYCHAGCCPLARAESKLKVTQDAGQALRSASKELVDALSEEGVRVSEIGKRAQKYAAALAAWDAVKGET